ncbi:MAG: hypothetical protein JWN25_1135, partial [Verrucomicrobiales bacterium]|nr:hypothetical protein [Verrucomicrobiales bacterium]
MVGSLSKALAKAGHRVGVVTPLYKGIKEKYNPSKMDYFLEVPVGEKLVKGEVYILEPLPNFTIYFIDLPAYFYRSSLYLENGRDFPDNAERFIFLSKAVVHLARFLPWKPEVVHVHDWQVGLVPALVLHHRVTQGWIDAPSTCLTIHNLAYQGSFPRSEYALTNLPWEFYHIDGIEFYGGMNCLKAAISYADVITTVSPRYAREITTELFGCGLDAALRKRQDDLVGILNGVDYEEWNTDHNPYLKHSYNVENLEGKLTTKLDLQKEFGLPINPEIPLFGNISRLADQKGIDIQLGALEEMFSSDMQFVLLGSGAANYERGYTKLAKRYPNKAGV